MADTIRQVDYYYTTVPDKPGEGSRVAGMLRDAGVNLLAFHAFPSARRSQVDLVPADAGAFPAAAKVAGIKLKGPRRVFLVDGDDRRGAIAGLLDKLAAARINVTAVDAVCSGSRYGALIWVKAKDQQRAAAALGAS
jgi:hypothetical protein